MNQKLVLLEGESNKPFVFSSRLSITDATNTVAMYKQLLKDQELIQNPETTIEQMLRVVTKQIISDIDEDKGIDIHLLDPDDISLAKTKEIIPASLNIMNIK